MNWIAAVFLFILSFIPASGFSQSDFAGLHFGIGLSLTADVGSEDRVEAAEVVNGIVRVTDNDRAVARIMLESHYFFTPDRPFAFGIIDQGNWGMGPFVTLQPGSDEIVEAIGLGWMVGLKRTTTSGEDESNSWNIGLGLVVDPNARTLGDGLKANQPLPEGEESIRFKENSQLGILILTSFSF